jgi:type VI secretion system secreted protein Hcp
MLYLSIDTISGNCTEAGYEDWIMLESFNLSVSNSLTSNAGNSERTSGGVQITEMNCAKTMDVSSLLLAEACAGNKNLGEVILSVTRTDGDEQLELVKYTLSDAMVSNISTAGYGGGDLPSESFSLNFTAIDATYTKQKPEGTAEGTANFAWDMKTRENKSAGGA